MYFFRPRRSDDVAASTRIRVVGKLTVARWSLRMETVVGDSNLVIPQTEDSGGVPRIVKHKARQ